MYNLIPYAIVIVVAIITGFVASLGYTTILCRFKDNPEGDYETKFKFKEKFSWKSFTGYTAVSIILTFLMAFGLSYGGIYPIIYLLNLPMLSLFVMATITCIRTDKKHWVIPNTMTYTTGFVAFIAFLIPVILTGDSYLKLEFGIMAVMSIVVFLLGLLIKDKIGGGDIKYIILMIWCFGAIYANYALLLACAISIIRYVPQYFKVKKGEIDKPLIQFGIDLGIASLVMTPFVILIRF